MEKTNENSCLCEKASCDCSRAKAERCTCGETCNCRAACRCGNGCGCKQSR
jgi:hypothetical protein